MGSSVRASWSAPASRQRRLAVVPDAPLGTRVLAVDLGERRVGLAMSDETGMLASELAVIPRGSLAEDSGRLRVLIAEHGVCAIVVGLPRSMRGELGWQAQRTQRWVDRMRDALPVPVETLDERLTTIEAERGMQLAGVSARDRQRRIDMAAAVVLLQAYLDSRRAKRNRRRA